MYVIDSLGARGGEGGVCGRVTRLLPSPRIANELMPIRGKAGRLFRTAGRLVLHCKPTGIINGLSSTAA